MTTQKTIDSQLKITGLRFRLFGRSEIRELKNVIQPNENIIQCAYGYYQGGSGLLVATNKRVILIDKRPFFLNFESIAFENIKSIDFGARFLQGSVYVHAGLKKLIFRSVSDARLREICKYVQAKVEKIEKPIKSSVTEPSQLLRSVHAHRPYLNPAWRPHHILPRPRPSKFYREPSKPVTS